MSGEIQSYIFFELIKFIIIVSITLRIFDALNSMVSVISVNFFISLL